MINVRTIPRCPIFVQLSSISAFVGRVFIDFFFFLFFFQFVALFRGHSPLARAAAAAAIIDSPLFIAHLSMGLVMRDTRNTRYLRFYR